MMAENNIETKLDPEKVAVEILGKIFNIKLEDCRLWKWGIARFTNGMTPDICVKAPAPKTSENEGIFGPASDGSICFAILQGSHIPHADQGKIVADAFEKRFFDIAFKELPILKLPKGDRDFIWMSLFGSGAPIGVLMNGDDHWVRSKGFEGFRCESLEQALIEFSLKEGIALGNG